MGTVPSARQPKVSVKIFSSMTLCNSLCSGSPQDNKLDFFLFARPAAECCFKAEGRNVVFGAFFWRPQNVHFLPISTGRPRQLHHHRALRGSVQPTYAGQWQVSIQSHNLLTILKASNGSSFLEAPNLFPSLKSFVAGLTNGERDSGSRSTQFSAQLADALINGCGSSAD